MIEKKLDLDKKLEMLIYFEFQIELFYQIKLLKLEDMNSKQELQMMHKLFLGNKKKQGKTLLFLSKNV
jgi:hypothetical protein